MKSRNLGTATKGVASFYTTGMATSELRPCGMLVQKRNSDVNQSQTLVTTIKVKVKYGSSYHEVNIKPQATFGNSN